MEISLVDQVTINSNLLQWAENSDALKCAFRDIGTETLVKKIADLLSNSEHDSELAAVDLYEILWGHYVELGPMPPIELLRNFEHDRVYYKNYRDHTAHTVKTLLIGLYIYEGNSYIQNAINSFIERNQLLVDDAVNSFLRIWTVTALYHDIGYIIENSYSEVPDSDVTRQVIQYINSVLQAPLAHTQKFSSIISEIREYHFIEQNHIFVPQIRAISNIEDDAFFDIFSSASQHSSLALPPNNGVKIYYNLAKGTQPVSGRNKFTDHGIASALLLLKIWNSYCQYLKDIDKFEYQQYYSDCATGLDELCKNLENFSNAINVAAAAISLHNISKEDWAEIDALNHKLTLKNFSISLTDCDNALPFAFLLRISDEIQMWSRPRYRAPSKVDHDILGVQMSLSVSNQGLYFRFFQDEDRFKQPSTDIAGQFYQLREKLSMYLDPRTINSLLKYGDAPLETDKFDKHENNSIVPATSGKKDNMPPDTSQDDDPVFAKKWIVGAINLDEDVHFSAYYLFRSLSNNLPECFKKFGYQNIISFYDNFNETYFIPQDECTSVSKSIIEESEQNPTFWDELFDNIEQRIKNLKDVFEGISVESFSTMSLMDLQNIIQAHDNAHFDLYTYARIPEALDRGNSTFTNYLKSYLRGRSEEFNDDSKLNDIFQRLTYPENLSYSSREIIELYKIVQQIRQKDSSCEESVFNDDPNRQLINMDAETRAAINDYANRWAFWGYHGYRNRVVRDFNYFLEKLRVNLKSNRIEEQGQKLLAKQTESRTDRALLYSDYGIDDKHKSLFQAYSRIGTIKIARRYVQLINFYYLDHLITEVSNRYKTSEAVIRCLLPSEVERLLAGDEQVLQIGEERKKAKVFALELINGTERFTCGEKANELFKSMKSKAQQQYIDRRELFGEIASRGTTNVISGTARVLSTAVSPHFKQGDILVCTDSDPDFFDYIKRAGAVLAETGGLTCHSAIVCRELGIPCIVRVQGLMESVSDGDYLEINTGTGRIKTISTSSNNILKSNTMSDQACDVSVWGRKASALMRLKIEGINVPEFFCIPISLLRSVFSLLEIDGKADECQALLSEINDAVEEINVPFFAVRSSTKNEDGVDFSGAGQESTRLHVSKDDILYTLQSLLFEIDEKNNKTEGSIIVQRMIFGEMSGVMFTCNPVTSQAETVIEAVRGGNDHMTSGKISPSRYTLSNDTIIEKILGDKWSIECTEPQLYKLSNEATKIENIFGYPQDIEWTMANDTLYILQSRNVTGHKTISREEIAPHTIQNYKSCISIYQKYALPQVLQDHLVRVAAVGKWIVDHWNTSEIILDETDIIETLLLHDIGNIVKGDDENFRLLFPDTYAIESFEFWETVRKWTREHYGKTDIEATHNIIREIGVRSKIQTMIEQKQFSNNVMTCAGSDFSIKICAYADQRVSPDGIMSLNGRLKEAIKRYQNVKGASVNLPERTTLIKCAKQIETQIFEHVNGSPEQITDESISPYFPELKCHVFHNLNSDQ